MSISCRTQDSLRTNVSKDVCFWLWGKDNIVQLPEEPSVKWTVDAVCFSGAATEPLKCICWQTFYKQGPVRRWICTSFDTERWSSPSYKRSRQDSELQMVMKRHQMSLFCWWSSLKCSSVFSSAHDAPPPGARLFSEGIVKLYLSFINMIKLKTFWRYEGCTTTL